MFRQLQEADWGAIGKELLAFAVWWAERYPWRSGTTQILPRGNTLEDIVQQVILKTIEGRRKWDPAKGPLVPWLKDQIKSEIDALAKSAPHNREIPFPEGEEGEERQDLQDKVEQRAVESGVLGRTRPQSPESIVLEREEAERTAEKVNAIFQAVEGEPELEEVLDAILAGCVRPRDLAEELDVPIREIYNRLRRLRRRASAIRSPQ